MHNIEPAQNKTDWAELSAQLLIEEYKTVRDEINIFQGFQSQIVLASLVTLGAAATFISQANADQIPLVLLVVSVLFSLMGMAYLGYLGISYRNANYIENSLKPQINLLFTDSPYFSRDFLNWQMYVRERHLRFLTFPKNFEPFLFLLPSVGSLVAFSLTQRGLPLSEVERLLLIVAIALAGLNCVFVLFLAWAGLRKFS